MTTRDESRVVLFGGTFDPVHVGHTAVAQAAKEKTGAERFVFILARKSPLKRLGPVAGDKDRVQMLELAIKERDGFEVSRWEIERRGNNYTIDTVRHFKQVYAGAAVYWLMGADQVPELGRWYKVEQLIDECELSVMYRGGFEKPDFEIYRDKWGDKRVTKLKSNVIETPLVDVSSTEIRVRLARGEDVEGMVDEQVREYILARGLYSRDRG